MRKFSAVKQILSNMDPKAFADTDGDGFDEIVDVNGKPFTYANGTITAP